MLPKEENELLCLTGPGTPMGRMMRRFWMPALLSWELPDPDCPPVRIRLMNEDLVAFRDSTGRAGLVGAHCPHRGAGLFFGRNEEEGLRCVYHGWKFDLTGQCVDMPNEPVESNFKSKIKTTAYPCEERGGVVWTYMGPPELKPGLPELEWGLVPEKQRHASKRIQECNWLQALEGGIDSSHISFLHGGLPPTREKSGDPDPISAGYEYRRRDKSPHFELIDTDYGLLIGARRNADEENYYWRITQWIFPWYTMIPPFGGGGIGGHAWVPIDDVNCWVWSFSWHPTQPFSDDQLTEMQRGSGIHGEVIPGTFNLKANLRNDFLIDREEQRQHSFTGIKGISQQDCAMQETMGPMFDRTKEHLGSSDTAIIGTRRRLLAAVGAHEEGIDPPALDAESYRVRSFSTLLPKGVPFDQGAAEGLKAQPGVFIASA
ncbi:MAG: hypothetical protein QOF51_1295 [Chloroflexota bacterium]|jgi:phenylpropionate dioxygenase-like ring-hydroxylating dioxygenase large terminal subunit|nr:hypothetical protein [Chloroflexota bacterium]